MEKIALIATVFNEGEDVFEWAKSLRAQTLKPDEFVIVDGGSTDGTPERLRQAFGHGDFPAPKIIVEKCNIARGRNLAFKNTMAEIVARLTPSESSALESGGEAGTKTAKDFPIAPATPVNR